MIKASGTLDGQPVILLGLTEENVRRLRAGKPIDTDGHLVGFPGRIVITHGQTEQHIVDQMRREGMPPQASTEASIELRAVDPELFKLLTGWRAPAGAQEPTPHQTQDTAPPTGLRWRAVLGPLDVPADDGRRLTPDFTLAPVDRPVPLVVRDGGPHHGLVIGTVDSAYVSAGLVWAEGGLTAPPDVVAEMSAGELCPQAELETVSPNDANDAAANGFTQACVVAVAAGRAPLWPECRFTILEPLPPLQPADPAPSPHQEAEALTPAQLAQLDQNWADAQLVLNALLAAVHAHRAEGCTRWWCSDPDIIDIIDGLTYGNLQVLLRAAVYRIEAPPPPPAADLDRSADLTAADLAHVRAEHEKYRLLLARAADMRAQVAAGADPAAVLAAEFDKIRWSGLTRAQIAAGLASTLMRVAQGDL